MDVGTTTSSRKRRFRWAAVAAVLLAAIVLALRSRWEHRSEATAATANAPARRLAHPDTTSSSERNTVLAALGRQLFYDSSLSEPPGTSCASCHEPAHGFSGTNGSKNGLAQGSRPGHFAARNTPSVLYLKFVKRFHYHWEEDMPLPDVFGGFFWDGRADSIASLVRQPLLNPDEMNNQNAAQIARKLDGASYASEFRRAFVSAGSDSDAVLASVGAALEAFLLSPEMAPFTSRYDAFVRGETRLTETEMRGLAIFKDRQKGNCLRCHKLDDSSSDPSRSLFTDYGFEVVGVPRNRVALTGAPELPDLGLCQRKGATKATKDERFCGAFRTPSLRNVAVRKSFMHNGAFSKLRDVVAFYSTRDTAPARWYPAERFDDLPREYQRNVNTDFAPYSTVAGVPRLDDADIDALVAFLGTLTDVEFQVAAADGADASGQRLAGRR
jgi:cytochrome c peroxidase